MFNLSTSGNVGYNGISQLSDVRCAPQYEGGVERPLSSPGGKLRAFLHSEAKGPPQPKRPPVPRLQPQPEDMYTFRDSDPPTSNPRLIGTPEKLEPIIVRKTDVIRSVKHPNGLNTIRENHVHNHLNGVHDKLDSLNNSSQTARVTVRQNKDLFANYPASDLRKFPPIDDAQTESIKNNSIISSLSQLDGKGSMYQDCQMNDAVVKKESVWGAEDIGAPLFSAPPKFSPIVTPRKLPSGKPPPVSALGRRGRGPALHEALQRITPQPWGAPTTPLFECQPLDALQCQDGLNNCLQPWLEGVGGSEPTLGRAERLAARRAALRRRATQLCHYTSCMQDSNAYSLHQNVKQQQGKSRSESFRVEAPLLDKLLSSRGSTALLSAADRKKIRTGCKLVGGAGCSAPGCSAPSLACAAYCIGHVAASPDQRLFSRCTAKFSDNTQCRMPVLNVTSHLPLCTEHAWKRDNYNKISQELKPKKAPRKRPKPSAMIRPQKRNRKRKKPPPPEITHPPSLQTQGSTSSGCEESAEETGMGLSEEFIEVATTQHIVDEEVVARVLGLQEQEAPAPSQEAQIDLSTVFNDFFTAEQNEEYIPTREETEELERALEAVNQDVKSLEKLTASQGSALLLDALLDERALAETLASLPDVFSPSPNCTA